MRVSALIAALALFCGEALAGPVTFDFEGMVTSTVFDPSDPFGGTIVSGTPITGSYTFESTAVDPIPTPVVGSYSMFGPPYGMTVDIGGNVFTTDDFLNVGVANDIGLGKDQYTVLGQEGSPPAPGSLSIQLFFEDPTGTVFSDDSLPLVEPDVGAFTTADFFLDAFLDFNNVTHHIEIRGTIKAIPEPGVLLLMGAAAVLGLRRRRD